MDKIALTNVRVFDGQVLLPGLIDSHVHLTDDATLTALARHGVTTALDMGTESAELVASQRGRPGVTDLRSSGASATSPASAHARRMGRARGLVADPGEAKGYVARSAAEGADYIKVIIDLPGFDEPTVLALVEAAHGHGRARSRTPPPVTPCCWPRRPGSTCSPTRPSTGSWTTATCGTPARPNRWRCPR